MTTKLTDIYKDPALTAVEEKVGDLYYSPTPVKTANYTASDTDLVKCDTSGGTFTVTLPLSGTIKVFDVVGVSQDTGFGVNSLILQPSGGTTIMGETALNINVGAVTLIVTLQGTDWKVFNLSSPSFVVTSWDSITEKPANIVNLDSLLDTKANLISPTFTGTNLILPNNSRINGVEHFYQESKPTVRGDGSALTVGDRWWKTDDGTEWWWNGTYWLNTQIRSAVAQSGESGYSGSNGIQGGPFLNPSGIFIIDACISFSVVTPNDISNYWSISCVQRNFDTAPIALVTALVTSDYPPAASLSRWKNVVIDVNRYASSSDATTYLVGFTKVGSPAALYVNSVLNYCFAL